MSDCAHFIRDSHHGHITGLQRYFVESLIISFLDIYFHFPSVLLLLMYTASAIHGKVYYDYNYRVLPAVRARNQVSSSSSSSATSSDNSVSDSLFSPQSLISWLLPSETSKPSSKYSIDFDYYENDNFGERY